MTQPRGGYQPPANPAPVGMPGALSRRTDGGPADQQARVDLPDAAYGEQQTFQQDQAGAPMAAAPGPGGGGPPVDLSQVVPFGAPTQRPDEPVTAGASVGQGAGPEALGLDGTGDQDPSYQQLKQLLPSLEIMANMPVAGPAFRQFVRRVRAMG